MLNTRCHRSIALQGRCAAGGFTLIELIVTMSVIGLLAGLGLPSMTAWIRNSQVRTVADALQNGLRTAQTEAVRRNQPVVISFTNDTNPELNPVAVAGGKNWSLQTVPSAFAENGTTPVFVRSGALADVASGVSIGGSMPTAVCFDSNGRLVANAAPTSSAFAVCAATPATFDIAQTNSDRPLRVTVAVGGQVRMCDPKRPALSTLSPDGCPP